MRSPLIGAFSVKKNQHGNNMQDLEVYPFWKLGEYDELVLRFLPDLNEHNPFAFIDEFHIHRVVIDGNQSTVLCSRKHEDNKPCHYCKLARRAYTQHKPDGRKYWRQQRYTGNVIIIDDPLCMTDSDNPKTYRVTLSKQLWNNVKDGMLDRKVTELPSDYFKGNDFRIRRVMAGQYLKYTGAFCKPSRLSDEQISLATESIVDLSQFRPKIYSSSCQDDLSKELLWEILND